MSEFCCCLSRSVLAVRGSRAVEFLHGLLTNNIEKNMTSAVGAALLTRSGMIVSDVIVYPPDDRFPSSILLDCRDDCADLLISSLRKYALRPSNANIVDLREKGKVFAIFNGENSSCRNYIVDDPRKCEEKLPQRLIKMSTDDCLCENQVGEEVFDRIRVRNVVPEGMKDFGRGELLATEGRLNELGMISLTKGCFVGQEVTRRSVNSGITVKKIFHVELSGDKGGMTTGSPILMNGSIVGHLCTRTESEAMAMIKTKALKSEGLCCEGGRIRVTNKQ